MSEQEIEFKEDAHPVSQHFQKSISAIELEKKLAYYLELCTDIDALTATKDALRKELIEAGRGEESILAGNYACFFKKIAGRVSTDWKRAYKDAVGEMPEAEVQKYITRGEESIRVEVKRLG